LVEIVGAESHNFLAEYYRIQYYAVSDDILDITSEYTGRDLVKYVLDSIELKRVTSVGASLESCNYLIVRSNYVNNFTFSFIAPLKAQQNIYFH